MLTSNKHSVMLRTMTNGDFCDFLKSSCGFPPHEPHKNAANINIDDVVDKNREI